MLKFQIIQQAKLSLSKWKPKYFFSFYMYYLGAIAESVLTESFQNLYISYLLKQTT